VCGGAASGRAGFDAVYEYEMMQPLEFVVLLLFPFDVFWGMCGENSCNVFFRVLHGTLGSYLRDALQKGGTDVLAFLHVSRA
jgi:hypothetical protein